MIKKLQQVGRRTAYLVGGLLIVAAIVIQSARWLSPFVDHFRPSVESLLTESIGSDVTIGRIDASWFGLRPHVAISRVQVAGVGNHSPFSLRQASVTLDLWHSVLFQRWMWRDVEINGVSLDIVQSSEHVWSVASIPLKSLSSTPHSSESFKAQQHAEQWLSSAAIKRFVSHPFFFQAPHIDISDVDIYIKPHQQKQQHVRIPQMTLEADQYFYRLHSSVFIEEQLVASILLERDQRVDGVEHDDFPKGFLQLDSFPVGEWFYLLGASLQSESHFFEDSTLSTAVWFDVTPKGVQLSGDLAIHSSPDKTTDHSATDDAKDTENAANKKRVSFTTQFVGFMDVDDGWDIGLRDTALDQTVLVPQIQFIASGKGSAELRVDTLDTGVVVAELMPHLDSQSETFQFLDEMALTGKLQPLVVDINVLSPKQSVVSATIDSVSTQPANNIPGFKNVSGYLSSQWNKGVINLSSENFHLFADQIYDAPITVDHAEGQVAWSIDIENNQIIVNSNNLAAAGEFGRANGYFLLDVPFKSDTRPGELILQIGVQDSSSEYYSQFVPNRVSESLREWLATSIQKGEVPQAGFIYRGGFSRDASKRTVQLFVDVNDGVLTATEEWPSLEGINASVMVDDTFFNASADGVQSLGQTLDTMQVTWSDDGRGLLDLTTSGTVSAESGLRFLNESDLRNRLGDTFSSWSASGDIDVDVELEISLDSSLTDSQRGLPKQRVTIGFNDNELELPEQNLRFKKLSGEMFFDEKKGLFSDKLGALLFEQPLDLHLQQYEGDAQAAVALSRLTQKVEGQRTVNQVPHVAIKGTHAVAVEVLADWLEQPAVNMLDGVIPYGFDLRIPVSKSEFQNDVGLSMDIRSSLQGVVMDFPEPFFKAKEASLPAALSIQLDSEGGQYAFTLGDQIKAKFSLRDHVSGFISVNSNEPAVITSDKSLSIVANVDNVIVDEWLSVVDRYQGLVDKGLEANNIVVDKQSLSAPVIHYRLDAKQFSYKSHIAKRTVVMGKRVGGEWDALIDNDLVRGNVAFRPEASTALTVDLDYLAIKTEGDLEASPEDNVDQSVALVAPATDIVAVIDPLGGVNLQGIPSASVAIKTVIFKGKALHDLSFELKPIAEGVHIDQLRLRLGELVLDGRIEGEGADLWWRQATESEQLSSEFMGTLSGGDVQSVFDEWGVPPALSNKELELAIHLVWSGSPAFFAVERARGTAKLEVSNGVFLQNSEQAGTEFLRLFSLFNFDTWSRRLRLDFSDLYKKGVVFDDMSALIKLNQGKLYFQEPLYVKSPSSEFTLAGVVDYSNETIDGVLITTLPIRGNLTFAAGLAGGLPTAVGVYLIGKLFKSQVDKFSSFRYAVSGSWQEPNVKVIELFDNDLNGGVNKSPSNEAQTTDEIEFGDN